MRGAAWASLVGAYPVTPIVVKPHQPQFLCDCFADSPNSSPSPCRTFRATRKAQVALAQRCSDGEDGGGARSDG
jgi:hypothetical protein